VVTGRTRLINSVRGQVKAVGGAMSSGSTDTFHRRGHELPETMESGRPLARRARRASRRARSSAARQPGDLQGHPRRKRRLARRGCPQASGRAPRPGGGAPREAPHAAPPDQPRGRAPELGGPLEAGVCGRRLCLSRVRWTARLALHRRESPATRRIIEGLQRATGPPGPGHVGDDRRA
jgi:hypothetical protein